MNKTFKIATKRITTIAATAALVSSTVFGANLAHYPTNFVDNSEFDGTVVIGSTADSAAATSIIADLTAELSGESEQIMITAKMTSNNGGDIVNALDDKSTLNFGSTVNSFIEVLDDDSTNLLADSDLDSEDYTQTLELGTGAQFKYELFEDVDGEEEAKAGLYLADGTVFAEYKLDFDSDLDDSDLSAEEFNGETITIMGNEFTVLESTTTSITMVGGANKLSLGEGDVSTISVSGVSYEVEIQSVADTKVLLSINGETKSVDADEVETVAGVTVGITEIVDSSRDSVKGYATLVIGGQKIEITASDLKVNDDDFEDIEMYEDYTVTAAFDKTGLTVSYAVDENVLLEEGESLTDVLFGAFTLSYDGTNEVEYSEFKVSTTSTGIDFSGNLYNGKAIPSEFELTADDVANTPLLLGSNAERIYFAGSVVADIEVDGDSLTGVSASSDIVSFDLSTSGADISGQKFYDVDGSDEEDMRFYEISSFDDNSGNSDESTLSFDELIESDDNDDVKISDVGADLDLSDDTAMTNTSSDILALDTSLLAEAKMFLENELILTFTGAEELVFAGANISTFNLSYGDDVVADNEADVTSLTFGFSAARASDVEDAIVLSVTGVSGFSEVEDGSDYEIAVDIYGTKVIKETDDYDELTFMVPDEEVYAMINFNFGDAGSSVETYTVSADMADAKIAELEEAGYDVTTEVLSTEVVTFDIVAPVMADEVSGMNDMIVVGGPAVNAVAVALLGEGVVGVSEGEAVVRYFSESNSVLVYGWDAAGTQAAANKLNAGGLTGEEVNVQ